MPPQLPVNVSLWSGHMALHIGKHGLMPGFISDVAIQDGIVSLKLLQQVFHHTIAPGPLCQLQLLLIAADLCQAVGGQQLMPGVLPLGMLPTALVGNLLLRQVTQNSFQKLPVPRQALHRNLLGNEVQ